MKRIYLFWLFPALSLALGLFIFTASQMRRQAMVEDHRRSLEQRVLLATRMVRDRAQQAARAREQIDSLVARGWLSPEGREEIDRQRAGVDAMLWDAGGWDVLYATIQHPDGVVAQSAGAPSLSSWQDDAELAAVHNEGVESVRFRGIELADGEWVLEGVAALSLPPSRVAVPSGPTVLRVGVGASRDLYVGRESAPRMWVVNILALLLVGGSLVVAWLLFRGEKRREEAEQRVLAREAESRHWQAIGQMAATVAHEVRNPLNTIRMAAQRLDNEFDIAEADRAEYGDLTTVLVNEADRVGKVVTEFLDLGRPLNLDRQSCPLATIVHEAVAPLQLRAEQEDKKLSSECDEGEATVDRRRLVQVIGNLINNALDAVSAGGSVHVECRRRKNEWHIRVQDDGAGMDSETLARVLEPFVTTRSRGTGLGLPLAKRLVEAHEGTFTLTSTPGQGTEAHVALPPTTATTRRD